MPFQISFLSADDCAARLRAASISGLLAAGCAASGVMRLLISGLASALAASSRLRTAAGAVWVSRKPAIRSARPASVQVCAISMASLTFNVAVAGG